MSEAEPRYDVYSGGLNGIINHPINTEAKNIMATISSVTFTPAASGNSNVKITVSYTLFPSQLEKLAGSVFRENIELWGDDGAIDVRRYTMPSPQLFSVNSATSTVDRSRSIVISKDVMNEDPKLTATGSELPDEIYAKVTLTYAANAGGSLPPPATSAVVTGFWK